MIENSPHAHLGTGLERFSELLRPGTSAVLKALSDGKPKTRAQIADDSKLSKNTVRHEADKLATEGHIQKIKNGRTYLYQLTSPTASKVIQRADGVFAQYCSCGAYVRYKREERVARVEYLFWCTKCGKRHFVEHPMG